MVPPMPMSWMCRDLSFRCVESCVGSLDREARMAWREATGAMRAASLSSPPVPFSWSDE